MTDEHLMRQWTDAHDQFSGDLDRGLLRLGRFVTTRLQGRRTIEKAYDPAACSAIAASDPASQAARAALAGVTAVLATSALLVTVALLATAGLHGAPAYPVVTHAIVA